MCIIVWELGESVPFLSCIPPIQVIGEDLHYFDVDAYGFCYKPDFRLYRLLNFTHPDVKIRNSPRTLSSLNI